MPKIPACNLITLRVGIADGAASSSELAAVDAAPGVGCTADMVDLAWLEFEFINRHGRSWVMVHLS